MKIKSIRKIIHSEPKQFYDVINADPYNNFLVKTETGYVSSHNCFFDEISFIPTQDIEKQKARAIDMIDTAIGGMKTRFTEGGKNPGMIILASSKRSEKSFLEEHMKKKIISEHDNVIIVDEAVWNVKPEGTYSKQKFKVAVGNRFLVSQVIPENEDDSIYKAQGYRVIDVPIDLRPDFIDDIDRALCDFAGISSSNLSTYISGARWEACKSDDVENPFTRDVIEVGNAPDDNQQYSDYFDLSKVPSELKSKPLFVHFDMSISGDKTGIGGIWIYGKKPSTNVELSKDLYFQTAFAVSVKAPKGYQVSFEKNRNFVRWLRQTGFNVKLISSDTFQSYDLQQQLKAENFNVEILSVDRVVDHICKPYQYLRSVIYEQRIRVFKKCDLLTNEVVSLERNNNTGKVDHPESGCFTGDTKVSLVDGRELSFFDLVKEWEDGKANFVYSLNLENGIIEPKKIDKAWCTRKNATLVAVTLDNGEIIKCTPNHKFMDRDGEYIESQYLVPGQSLMTLNRKYTDKVLSEHGKSNIITDVSTSGRINHKVVSVEFLDDRADVYDIEVEDNHNFALSSGIFVHNSKDQSDAICGATFEASKYAEEYAFDYGDDLDVSVDANMSDFNSESKQITVDFEEELKKVFQNKTTSAKDLDFGFGPSVPMTTDTGALISEGLMVW